jgi:FkbM family methyltransferase
MIVRLLDFLTSLAVGIENLGFLSGLDIILLNKFRRKERTRFLRFCGKYFTFRGRFDRSVTLYFVRAGFRIVDSVDRRVEYIIDAGANIGDQTIRFRHFHPHAKIAAIEPEKDNVRILRKNCGDDKNIFVVEKGLWFGPARLNLIKQYSPYHPNEAFRVTEAVGNDSDLEATSVDEIMDQLDFPRVDILKLDIEGAEYHVFSKNTEKWISKVLVIIFECNDSDMPGAAQTIMKATSGIEFDCFLCGEYLVMIRRDTGWRLSCTRYYD